MKATEYVCPPDILTVLITVTGDGEQRLVGLSRDGRLFERYKDPRAVNEGRGPAVKYLWKEVDTPFTVKPE